MGFCDWFGDLHSLSADFLQLSIKSGLEALGEHDAAKADETGSGESDKPIMPVMLMSLMVLTILSMVIALSVYSGVWAQYINVIPTRIMVLTTPDAVEEPRGPILDGKFDEKQSLVEESSTSNVNIGKWTFLPIYAFHEVSDLHGRFASYITGWLPTHIFGQHLAFVGTAVVLCPLMWCATAVTIGTATTTNDNSVGGGDSKPKLKNGDIESKTKDSTSDDGFSKIHVGEFCLQLIRIVARIYTWLAPVTILWAVAVEVSKEGALRLSRQLSLAQYAYTKSLLSDMSNTELSLVAVQGACVLAVYVLLWASFALPATISMRRMHASESIFEMPEFKLEAVSIDNSIRSKTDLKETQRPTFASALQTFSLRSYRRLLVHYARWFFVLALLFPFGLTLTWIMVSEVHTALGFDAAKSPYQYMGFWASLFLYSKRAVGMSS